MNLPMQKLGKLDRMETASVDELRHEQLQRLRWSVWHALPTCRIIVMLLTLLA